MPAPSWHRRDRCQCLEGWRRDRPGRKCCAYVWWCSACRRRYDVRSAQQLFALLFGEERAEERAERITCTTRAYQYCTLRRATSWLAVGSCAGAHATKTKIGLCLWGHTRRIFLKCGATWLFLATFDLRCGKRRGYLRSGGGLFYAVDSPARRTRTNRGAPAVSTVSPGWEAGEKQKASAFWGGISSLFFSKKSPPRAPRTCTRSTVFLRSVTPRRPRSRQTPWPWP